MKTMILQGQFQALIATATASLEWSVIVIWTNISRAYNPAIESQSRPVLAATATVFAALLWVNALRDRGE